MVIMMYNNVIIMVMYVNKTDICKFANDNRLWYTFCLGGVSKDFTKDGQSEISLNGTVYDFSVDIVQLKKKTYLNFTNI